MYLGIQLAHTMYFIVNLLRVIFICIHENFNVKGYSVVEWEETQMAAVLHLAIALLQMEIWLLRTKKRLVIARSSTECEYWHLALILITCELLSLEKLTIQLQCTAMIKIHHITFNLYSMSISSILRRILI